MADALWWQERFHGLGVKITPARKTILSILNQTKDHLSAEEIFNQAYALHASIGLATIYRTLALFEQMGIADKFVFGDNKTRYELINNPHGKEHHHHLVCVKCKLIFDYSDFVEDEVQLINETEKQLLKKYNFKILDHVINFYGLCSKCQHY